MYFTRDNYSKPLPRYVVRELKRYIGRGLLDRGFSRLRCRSCGADMLLAVSCKARICPSCAGRRMAQSGIHLVDHVLPSAPLRQWVVSFPWQLRELLAAKADVFSSVHRIFERVSILRDGSIAYRCKYRLRSGATARVMSPTMRSSA